MPAPSDDFAVPAGATPVTEQLQCRTSELTGNPVVGEIRGPWRTSPGNPLPWMAYCRGPNGWIPNHAKSAVLAIAGARKTAEMVSATGEAAPDPDTFRQTQHQDEEDAIYNAEQHG